MEIAATTQTQTVVVSQLSAPTSVAIDGAGNLYVAESTGVVMIPNENGTLNPADMQTLQIVGLGSGARNCHGRQRLPRYRRHRKR